MMMWIRAQDGGNGSSYIRFESIVRLYAKYMGQDWSLTPNPYYKLMAQFGSHLFSETNETRDEWLGDYPNTEMCEAAIRGIFAAAERGDKTHQMPTTTQAEHNGYAMLSRGGEAGQTAGQEVAR